MVRAKKLNEPFTIMPNTTIRSGLSLKAIGLLTFMLSLPDDWDYSVEGLCTILPDGKTSIQSGIHELEEHRFLVRTQSRENGKFGGADWLIDYKPIPEEALAGEPPVEEPSVENTPAETTPQTNNRSTNIRPTNKDQQSKEDITRHHDFEEFWKEYPRKTGKGQAQRAFNKACRNETDFAAIMHGLSEQNRLKFEPMIADGQGQYIPYPATWLNGHRWEDDVEPYEKKEGFKNTLAF